MKIAVTSQGTTLDSPVDPRFGRARYFIIYDTDTGGFECVDNEQNVNAPQGAGIQSAENIARHKIKALLTGHCGPNAFRTLSSAGIQVYTGLTGTVREAVEDFKAGRLTASGRPDVQGHWGLN